MSVLDFPINSKFVIRIIKYLATSPRDKWANSYEFRSLDVGDSSTLSSLVESLSEFEAAFHKNTVLFDRAVVSTWEADSVPYDPSAFLVIPLSMAGGIGPVGDNLALNLALSVARVAFSGRVGHLFYRGVLNEADTAAPAGRTILTDRASMQGVIDGALTSSGLGEYIGATASQPVVLCMIDKTGSVVRNVQDLSVQGVATIKTDHAWFNRTTPGGPS